MPARLQRLISRVVAFLRPSGLDRDFDQELESHLSMLSEDYVRRGMSPEQALRAARIELGGHTQLREAHRAARGLPWIDSFFQDIHYAMRALHKNPGFTAIVTLAVGIGVNTAVFTAYSAWALRPVQAKEPNRLVQITWGDRNTLFSYPITPGTATTIGPSPAWPS